MVNHSENTTVYAIVLSNFQLIAEIYVALLKNRLTNELERLFLSSPVTAADLEIFRP